VKVESKLDDFEAVREFYEGYWQSYDKLVLEVARRKSAEEKIRKIMQDAKTRMKLLYDGEGSFTALLPLRLTLTDIS